MLALLVNGVTFQYPETGDEDWGDEASGWAEAITTGTLQKAGGSFVLTAEVDFGASFGLKSSYYKSRGTVSTAGVFRLGNNESVGWRNQANGANKLLKLNTSDILEFDGNPVLSPPLGVLPVENGGTGLDTVATGDLLLATGSDIIEALTITGSANKVLVSNGTLPSWGVIVDAMVDVAAAISFSKINPTLSANADFGTTYGIRAGFFYGPGTVASSGDIRIQNSGQINWRNAANSDNYVLTLLSSNVLYTDAVVFTAPSLEARTGPLTIPEIATPSAPSSGYGKVYAKSDGKLYFQNDSGTESSLQDIPNSSIVTDPSSPYSVASGVNIIFWSASGGAKQVDLPTAVGATGRIIEVIKTDTSFNAITIEPSGTETIGGVSNTTLNTQGERLRFISDNANWQIISREIPAKPVSYTPSLTTNAGANAVTLDATGKTDPWGTWQRVGNYIEIDAGFGNGSGGGATGTAGDLELSLPSGLPAIDTTYATSSAQISQSVGIVQSYQLVAGSQYGVNGAEYIAATSRIKIQRHGTNTFVALSTVIANSDARYKLRFPVTGWNS